MNFFSLEGEKTKATFFILFCFIFFYELRDALETTRDHVRIFIAFKHEN